MRYIDTTAHLHGRSSTDFADQLSLVYAEFINGKFAIQHIISRFGKFDLALHRRMFIKILSLRKASGLDDIDDIEQARVFMLSCETIDWIRHELREFKRAEIRYAELPKNTPEQIEYANSIRRVPINSLDEAYCELQQFEDSGIVFRKHQYNDKNPMLNQSSNKVRESSRKNRER